MRWIALAILVLAAPLAQAHVESYTQARALAVGPYLVYFEPRPTPPFAQDPASMVAQISDNQTGRLLRDLTPDVVVEGPGGFEESRAMEPDGTGYYIASMTLPAAGNYTARVHLEDPSTNGTHVAQVEFEVFPNIPYRIRPVDQTADTFVGQRTPLAFEIVDPLTFARKDPGDLSVRVEHWSEDHTQFLGAEEVEPTRVSPGVWRIDHVFAREGMYHIRFASDAGGFNYADVPLLHVYATSPPDASRDGGEQTPWPLLGAAAAVLATALALSRRRR